MSALACIDDEPTEILPSFVTICCGCGRAKVNGKYVFRPDMVAAATEISHGICRPCANRLYGVPLAKDEVDVQAA